MLRSALGKVCCCLPCLREKNLEEDVQIGSLEDIRDENEAQPLIADLFNDEEFLQQDEEKVIDFLASDELMTDKIDCQHVSEDQYDEYFETEVYSEEAVFEAAMTWLEKSKQDEDDKNAANVLQAVRLTLLKPSQLEKLEQHPLVMASSEAQEMIQHVKLKNQEVPVESSDEEDQEQLDDAGTDFRNGTRRTIILDIWNKLLQNLREGGNKHPQESAPDADSPKASTSEDDEKTQGSSWNIFRTISRLFSSSDDVEAKSAPDEDTEALINPTVEEKLAQQMSHTRAKRRWIQTVGKIELQRALKNLDLNPKVRRERLVKSLYLDEANLDMLPIPDIDTLRRPLTLKEEFENTKPWEIVTRMKEYEDAIGAVKKPRKFSASIADLADMETCYMYKPRKNTLKGRSSMGKSETCLEIIERNKVKTNRPAHRVKKPDLQTTKPKRKTSNSRRVKSVALINFTEVDLIAAAKEEATASASSEVQQASNVEDQEQLQTESQQEKTENELNQEKDEMGLQPGKSDSELHQGENEKRSTQSCENEEEPESMWSELMDKFEEGAEEVVETVMDAVTDASAAVFGASKLVGTALTERLQAVADLVGDSSSSLSESSKKKKKEPLDVDKILPTILEYKPRKGMAEHVFFVFGKPGILCCDADTKSWYKVSSLPEDYVESPSIAAHTCMFYLTGGALMVTNKKGIEHKKTVRRGYAYNFMKDKWSKLPRMNTPRYGHTSVVIEGTLYVIGGQNENESSLVHMEKYNQAAKVWEVCDSADIVSCKPILAACHRHKLYIIYHPNSHQAILRAYHTEKNTWYKRKLELPFEPSIFMSNDGKLFVVNMNMKKNFPARAKVFQVCFEGKIRDVHRTDLPAASNPEESPHIIYLLANEYVKPLMIDLHMEENLTAEPIPDTYRVIKYDLGSRAIRDLDKIRVENVHGSLTREKSQVGWYARDLVPCDNFRMRTWKTLEDDTWEVVVKKVKKADLEESDSDDADDKEKTEEGKEEKTEEGKEEKTEEQVEATKENQEGLPSQGEEGQDVEGEQDDPQAPGDMKQEDQASSEPAPGPMLIDVLAQVIRQDEQAPEQNYFQEEQQQEVQEQDRPDGYLEGYDDVFEEQQQHDGHDLRPEHEQDHLRSENDDKQGHVDLEHSPKLEHGPESEEEESEEEESEDESESDADDDSEEETEDSCSDEQEMSEEEQMDDRSEGDKGFASEEETDNAASREDQDLESEEETDVGSEDDETESNSEEETDDATSDGQDLESEDGQDPESEDVQDNAGSEDERDQESMKEHGHSGQEQDTDSKAEEEGGHLGSENKDISSSESEIEEEQDPFKKSIAQEPEKNQSRNGEGAVENEENNTQGKEHERLRDQRTPGQIFFYGSDDSEVEDFFPRGQQDSTVNKDEPLSNIKDAGQYDNPQEEKKDSRLEHLKKTLEEEQNKDSNRDIPSKIQDQQQEKDKDSDRHYLNMLNQEQDEDSDEIEAM
ncbi:hypothetical protein Bbelb_031820 [Branchiostoma belcheri]|nr:hypothetical protein Bbelb_031820 [Branchiostoma belcheri]